ncbi:MAG: SAM-dependent methyltransferase [Nitrospinae bacterium CG11_big_fil_rev_8_21_14_0_20_56_8]|nr:MAG: SAM-dependent methyltransferase [Nitrospinae bacterium CG11_big_fil_rev_8_21_14_0_20_56_8]
MSQKDKEKWNQKYTGPDYISGRDPSEWLVLNRDLLAGGGRALDLAAGEGRNSIYAAERGYQVAALDISEVALAKAERLANEKNIKISTVIADLDSISFETDAYDLILCFNFLDRNLFPSIRNALRPGGLLFYETFTMDYLKYSSFKKEWVLEPNELLRAFAGFRILRYREVDRPEEEKAFASLVARKECVPS